MRQKNLGLMFYSLLVTFVFVTYILFNCNEPQEVFERQDSPMQADLVIPDSQIYQKVEKTLVAPKFTSYSNPDKQMMAKVLFKESRGEPDAGQRAIVKLILNRRDSKIFGDSIQDILNARGQFEMSNTYTAKEMSNVEYVISNGFDLPQEFCYFGTWRFRTGEYKKIGNHYFMR